jgi:FlgD Ig-like domain
MFTRLFLLALFLSLASTIALAGPEKTDPRIELIDDQATFLQSPVSQLEKAVVDTIYLLGGPDQWEGKFEDAAGNPDWHGWTHQDASVPKSTDHWHVSTYWAAGLNGHSDGNLALVCVDESLPACTTPDTVGGTGNSWVDDAEWSGAVDNPLEPITLRLTAFMNHDLEGGWDFIELYVYRGESLEMLGQWTGKANNVELDISAVLQPADLVGPGGDEVRFFWRVLTDHSYSDEDCWYPSHGAAQIDDISIYFNDELISFYDFESGDTTDWTFREMSAVGDFASLRSGLPDADPNPCGENTSVQVSFIDDGLVVPGVGPSYCQTHCYGLGGFIVNNTGGLMADMTGDPGQLFNVILSPAIEIPPGAFFGELALDVYRHQPWPDADTGMVYFYYVRHLSGPDEADNYTGDGNFRYYAYGPNYMRRTEKFTVDSSDDSSWIQIVFGVFDYGPTLGLEGTDGTPGPYFDNVSLKVWEADGPDILVAPKANFTDAFPEQGSVDTTDLASNWCRIDSSIDLDGTDGAFAAGDSLVAEFYPARSIYALLGPPQLHWVMDCNPIFDAVRPVAPGSGGILRGSTEGWEPSYTKWAFDLPDSGWFFPGDRLRYYITSSEESGTWPPESHSVWPADTTGILDFSLESTYPGFAEVRAFPGLSYDDGEYVHPEMLYCEEIDDSENAAQMLSLLSEVRLYPGDDFDHFRIRSDSSTPNLGLGASATVSTLSDYRVLLYNSGTAGTPTLAGVGNTNDDTLFAEWLDLGNKRALLMGDGLLSGMELNSPGLSNRLGFIAETYDISQANGGSRKLRVNPVVEDWVLPDDGVWAVDAQCPRNIDGVMATGSSVTAATLDPSGEFGGPHAAVIMQTEPLLNNRIALMPFSEVPPRATYEVSCVAYTSRACFLREILLAIEVNFGPHIPPFTPVPEARPFTFQIGPNPFNPLTTVEFFLPQSAAVTLDIYDMQGRRVRELLNETMAAGPHSQVWNGRDGLNRQASSGIYFYQFTAGDQQRKGKLTLLK